MTRTANLRLAAFTLLALALLMTWDASGADLWMARMAGTPMGFPWRESPFLVHVMHEGARDLSWLLLIGLFAAIRWPVGVLRQLAVRERAQLAATALASVLAISLIKHFSDTSCPWDLQEFGGIARYVSHWSWGVSDGGAGGCFPAGHASAAFAYLGGYFVLRRVSARAALVWLGCAVVAGLALGTAQQLRGAHYTSHTLWTAWICWAVAFVIDVALTRPNRNLPETATPLHAST